MGWEVAVVVVVEEEERVTEETVGSQMRVRRREKWRAEVSQMDVEEDEVGGSCWLGEEEEGGRESSSRRRACSAVTRMWKCPSRRFRWRLMRISTRRQSDRKVLGEEAKGESVVAARAEMAETVLSVESMFH